MDDDWGYPHDLRKLFEIALLILICGRDPNAADVFLTWNDALHPRKVWACQVLLQNGIIEQNVS